MAERNFLAIGSKPIGSIRHQAGTGTNMLLARVEYVYQDDAPQMELNPLQRIGSIRYSPLGIPGSSELENNPLAVPLFNHLTKPPIVGEHVLVFQNVQVLDSNSMPTAHLDYYLSDVNYIGSSDADVPRILQPGSRDVLLRGRQNSGIRFADGAVIMSNQVVDGDGYYTEDYGRKGTYVLMGQRTLPTGSKPPANRADVVPQQPPQTAPLENKSDTIKNEVKPNVVSPPSTTESDENDERLLEEDITYIPKSEVDDSLIYIPEQSVIPDLHRVPTQKIKIDQASRYFGQVDSAVPRSYACLLDVIAYGEGTIQRSRKGGYDVLFGGLVEPSWNPNYTGPHFFEGKPSTVITFKDRAGNIKRTTTSAAGRYQFQRGTWKSLRLGSFSKKNQDIGGYRLIQGRIGSKSETELKALLTTTDGIKWILRKIEPEWESMPIVDGSFTGNPNARRLSVTDAVALIQLAYRMYYMTN